MRNDELRLAMARLSDAKATRRASAASDARPPVTAADRIAMPFRRGDRVVDLRTGQDGTVTDATPSHRDNLQTVTVRLDAGAEVVRGPDELVSRPRWPARSATV